MTWLWYKWFGDTYNSPLQIISHMTRTCPCRQTARNILATAKRANIFCGPQDLHSANAQCMCWHIVQAHQFLWCWAMEYLQNRGQPQGGHQQWQGWAWHWEQTGSMILWELFFSWLHITLDSHFMEKMVTYFVHFILEDINVIRGDPPFWAGCSIISSFRSWAEGIVDKFEGIIAIHGCQETELEWCFTCSFVQAWRANIFLLPPIASSKGIMVSFLNIMLDFEKAVICRTDLISKICLMRKLCNAIELGFSI